MEIDIKESYIDLGASGSFTSVNQIFSALKTIYFEPSASRSGRVIDATMVLSGSTNPPTLDLLFFPVSSSLSSSISSSLQSQQFSMSFAQMANCVGRVRVLGSDFQNVGGHMVANLYNLNLTFQGNGLYLIGVYQTSSAVTYTANSTYLNIGYELGQNKQTLF